MRVVSAVIVVVGFLSAAHVAAQPTYEQIHAFQELQHPLTGRLAEAPDGTLFGVGSGIPTSGVRGPGAVLKFVPQPDGTLVASTLYAFRHEDGVTPRGGVIYASDGMLYGTTCEGGPANSGSVFRLSPAGAFTLLYAFPAPEDGGCPLNVVEAADGHLYGATKDSAPGISGGTIFRITKAGAFSTLHQFSSAQPAGGYTVHGPLVPGPGGELYGVTLSGGVPVSPNAFAVGTFFKMDLAGTVTTLHSFQPSASVLSPRWLVGGTDGNFYGASTAGSGVPVRIFRMTPAGVMTQVAFFTGSEGTVQQGLDGALYVSIGSEANNGALYRIAPGVAPSTIHTFTYWDGSGPTELVRLSDGTMYGSTRGGGLSRRGVVFRINTPRGITVLNALSDPTPLNPQGPMVVGPDGALYGTSCGGGSYNTGAVFRLASGETVPTTIYSFAYWDGGCPQGALAIGADGALYGAASKYGLGGGGTLFRVTTAGAFTPLRFLSGPDGYAPSGGLLRASDDHFYGTTAGGGSYSGTIFRLTSTGTFSVLHAIGNGSVAPLVQGSDGFIYGGFGGTPFRMTMAGALTTFALPSGSVLTAPFAEGSDTSQYGLSWTFDSTTGATSSVFRLTPSGPEPPLTTFAGLALGGLLLASDGLFYGTSFGDQFSRGSVFQVSSTGSLVPLHTFGPDDGSYPAATLTLAPDGAMYGSTLAGGYELWNGGTLFRLVPPAAVQQRK